ncbi:MAG: haloacid dehalogenase type II [Geminicoccaceae bacterium]
MRARAFDAYGTLFDVHSAVARHAAVIGPQAERLSELWRSRQLEYTWVLNGIGAYEDFWTLTERALDTAIALAGGVPDGTRPRLLDAYADLAAYPDVASTLRALKQAGETVILFSNATPVMLTRALAATGLTGLIDHLLSVDSIRAYKPLPAAYALLDPWRGPDWRLTFHSSNAWDAAGAVARGIDTVWVNRRGAGFEYPGFAPGAAVADLAAITNGR